ncbi:enterobactin synthetase component D [Luteibacter sp. W1I16]|uniref:4'-phosphopantetheinyl transferase family protein n=1 Tax=Luteibacter sp. W1I16 TaxID=3373922 RepID=UPI003D1B30C4
MLPLTPLGPVFSASPAHAALCVGERFTLPLASGSTAHGILLHFDAAAFHPSLFTENGIAMPDSVARSVVKRQADFFHGRLAARLALRSLGIDGDTAVGLGDRREPLWPAATTGSISHTAGIAGAVVASSDAAPGLGLDIEHVVSGDAAAALRGPVVDAAEQAVLDALFGDDPLLGLTIAFSAKESLYKALFPRVGAFFDFDAAIVQYVDTAARTVRLMLRTTLAPALPAGTCLQVRYDLLSPRLVMTHFA